MEDLVMLSEVDAQLSEKEFINEDLQNEKDILQERYESLVKDLEENQEAERMAKTKVVDEIQDLKIQNQNLQNYIEGLGQDLDFSNSGGKLSAVGERQQRRKITELKPKEEKALWFAKTFGLDLPW
jgi:dsDNA-specific endonuclease/ATPase MutS2